MPGPPKCPEKLAALAAGSNRYFTGRPCKNGHVAERWVRSGTCVQCNIRMNRIQHLRHYVSNPERFAAYRKRARTANTLGILVRGAKARAKAKGVQFALTKHDLALPEYCPCCQQRIWIDTTKKTAQPHSPSLDRLRPALGYVVGNVAVICLRCNEIKGRWGEDDLRMVADWLGGYAERSRGKVAA